MAEKLEAVPATVLKRINDASLLQLRDGRLVSITLPGYMVKNVQCWTNCKGSIEEITYEHTNGKIGSVNLHDAKKHYSKTNFENKRLLNSDGKEIATQLGDLPPLKQGFVRLKHRCMSENVGKILGEGLVFNRGVAKTNVGGACYDDITAMATCYENSNEFWDSMKKDDFSCFDNSRFADTQIIMDMPLKEFEFLQSYGRFVHGKVDSKYIVGVVRNYNGSNKGLVIPATEVEKAQKQSENNEERTVNVNDIEMMRTALEWRKRKR